MSDQMVAEPGKLVNWTSAPAGILPEIAAGPVLDREAYEYVITDTWGQHHWGETARECREAYERRVSEICEHLRHCPDDAGLYDRFVPDERELIVLPD